MTVALDRAMELLPLFRLSDSGEESSTALTLPNGSRWRVLPAANDRLPGTFDQNVYVELLHRLQEAGYPSDGVVRFTLHAFLRSMGRKVDGRTYEQLRAALLRLERTTLEAELEAHEKENPVPQIKRLSNGEIIPEGTPVASLVIPGGVAELELHPEAVAELSAQRSKTATNSASATA